MTYDYSWTNASRGIFASSSVHLVFLLSQADDSGFPNYPSHEERIGGKTAKIAETYYGTNAFPQWFIDAAFHHMDGKELELRMMAFCQTTNDHETAMTILRTISFK
jgi:hypothetical protein